MSSFVRMTASVKNRIEALTKKAKEGGIKISYKLSSRSSLHKIIRTPEQAKQFMRLLEASYANKE